MATLPTLYFPSLFKLDKRLNDRFKLPWLAYFCVILLRNLLQIYGEIKGFVPNRTKL